jgi:hypothetical protein
MKIFAKSAKRKKPEVGVMRANSYDLSDLKYLGPSISLL